jgi:glucose/arabinose dehydrogenase
MKIFPLFFGVAFIFCAAFASSSSAQPRIEYKTRDVATDLNCPWEIRWGKDNWIWFTERAGRFDRVNPETGERKILLQESDVYSQAEAGMLGFDFHPNFPDSPYIYTVYTYIDSLDFPDTMRYFEKVVRYTYSPDTLTDRRMIFGGIKALDGLKAYLQHNGSRIAVGPDKKLYISTGETWGEPELAQEDTCPNGKILRLNLDGSIPADNPWKGSPVWSKGHRNPQGLVFGPEGILYETEHGPASDDEFNIIERGRNFGWPVVEGFCDREVEAAFCHDSNVVEPLVAWTPTVAPSGTEYYNSDRIPEWKNSILIMTLKDESIWQVPLDETHRKPIGLQRYHIALTQPDSLKDSIVYAKRLRDICISPDGRVFVSTSNIWSPEWNPDRIFEIIRVGRSGVEGAASTSDLRVSPNPAEGRISISGLPETQCSYLLSDEMGRVIRSGVLDLANNSIPAEHLSPGLYCISVVVGNKGRVLRAIVQ